MNTSAPTILECPWCRYDLHAHLGPDDVGVDLMTCPECGGQTDVQALRDGLTFPPRWSFERRGTGFSFPGLIVKSMAAMLIPVIAWRRLQPEQRISKRRLAGVIAACTLWLCVQIPLLVGTMGWIDPMANSQLGFRAITIREILGMVINPLSTTPMSNGFTPWDYCEPLLTILAATLAVTLGVATIFATSLLLLRTTRGRAGAGAAHIVRAWTYALPVALAWAFAIQFPMLITFYLSYRFPFAGGAFSSSLPEILLLLMGVWTILFWYSAVRWYLRLRHAAAITVLNGVLTLLVLLVGIWVLGIWVLGEMRFVGRLLF